MDTHPREIKGITGGIDEIAVISYAIPYVARSVEECATVARGRIVNGLPEKSRTWQAGEGAVFIVTVIYQGQQDPSESPQEVQTSVRPSFSEEPIESHPDIIKIMEKYAGSVDPRTGRITFQPNYTPGDNGDRGLPGGSSGGSAQKKNPFFGVEKYMKLNVTFTRTYAAKALPGNLLSQIGRVVGTPPGAPAGYKNRKKWLVMPPAANQRGNVVEVTEEYLLLDDDIAPEMYKNA